MAFVGYEGIHSLSKGVTEPLLARLSLSCVCSSHDVTLRLALSSDNEIIVIVFKLIVDSADLNLPTPAWNLPEAHLNLHGRDLLKMGDRELGGIVGIIAA